MQEHGFYIIKDTFFEEMQDPYLKGNKGENRPHYFCIADSETDLFWMIPLSSRIDKYRKIIEKKEQRHQPCDVLHIAKLANGKESTFLIQDIFPITEEYIERAYTIKDIPFVLKNQKLIDILERKAHTIIGLIKHGVRFMPTQPDVLRIMEKLANSSSTPPSTPSSPPSR